MDRKASIDPLLLAEMPEIRAAARWWVNTLCGTTQTNSGDVFADVLKDVEASKLKPIDEETKELFFGYLCLTIASWCARTEWRTDNPMWGSGMRVIHCDYSPAPALEAAAERVGIRDLYFRCPWKTNMWVNPGEVKVSLGYRGPDEIIYPED